MSRRTTMFPARSIGEVSAPTPTQGGTGSYHARMPTIVTINVYVQEWLAKRRGRMTFSLGPPVYQCIQLDAIGTMTTKYFLVDNISPSRQDEIAVTFPPLTAVETKDLARTVQKILEQMVSPKKCKPVRADILDVEIVVG